MKNITTIPLRVETRQKLRELGSKSETWDEILNRMYENTLLVESTRLFFEIPAYTYEEAVQEINKW